MTAIFVTATGTDVGKTFVTAGLIRHLRRSGRIVEAIKPVVTGFHPARALASDPGMLLDALGVPVTWENITAISPWRFRAPLAPDMAAQREGTPLDFSQLCEFSLHTILARRDILFIEGIGGAMVPLDQKHTVLDWMKVLKLPVILVAGSYLGSISHTLTTLDVLLGRDLKVLTIVVSESEGSTVPLDDTVATLERFAHPVGILRVPRTVDEAADPAPFAQVFGGGLRQASR
jgi:dethiobiotin synthetase